MTGTAIINAALTDLGVIEPGNTPPAVVSTFCLEKLNRLLSTWATKRLLVFVMNHASYAFTTSQQSYTIGPASSTPDFTAVRPVKIERANVVIVSGSPDTHIPLDVINTQDYAALNVPALSADYPTRLYYQPTATKGTLWPWPYPTNTSNELELFTWNQLAQIATADVGVDYPLPPGYDNALILSLAESILPTYPNPSAMLIKDAAREARAAIMGINSKPPQLDLGGNYDGAGWYRSDFLAGGLA